MTRTGVSNPSKDCGIDEDFRFLTGQSEAARSKGTLTQIQLCIGEIQTTAAEESTPVCEREPGTGGCPLKFCQGLFQEDCTCVPVPPICTRQSWICTLFFMHACICNQMSRSSVRAQEAPGPLVPLQLSGSQWTKERDGLWVSEALVAWVLLPGKEQG